MQRLQHSGIFIEMARIWAQETRAQQEARWERRIEAGLTTTLANARQRMTAFDRLVVEGPERNRAERRKDSSDARRKRRRARRALARSRS